MTYGSAPSRIPGLDGLRAVAVVLVFLLHTVPAWIQGGYIGVDIFFVLSGYLITMLLMRELTETNSINFRRFYLRRSARLFPALIEILIVAALVLPFLPRHPPVIYTVSDIFYSATYTMDFHLAAGEYGGYLGHTWSLAIEEQYYLIWPLVLIVLFKTLPPGKAPIVIVCLALLSLIEGILLLAWGYQPDRVYFGVDTRALALFTGSALAFFPENGDFGKRLGHLWGVPVAVIAVVAVWLGRYALLRAVGGYGLIALMAAWLIVALRSGSRLTAFLCWRPMAYIGRISYGLYLWHLFILGLSTAFAIRFPMPMGQFLFVLTASLVVSALSYHFVERPILRMAHLARREAPAGLPGTPPGALLEPVEAVGARRLATLSPPAS